MNKKQWILQILKKIMWKWKRPDGLETLGLCGNKYVEDGKFPFDLFHFLRVIRSFSGGGINKRKGTRYCPASSMGGYCLLF